MKKNSISLFSKRWHIPATLSLLLLLASCEYFRPKREIVNSKNKIAEVGGYALYESDIKGLEFSSPEDSADAVERYINNWARRQSLLMEAEKNLNLEDLDIQRKVDNFRYELIVYEYKKRYLERHLDRDISDEEVLEYYENNKDNFQLKQNIIKCRFMKFPLNTPKISRAKRWFYSNDESSYEKLRDFAATHAVSYAFEDSTWVKFDEIALNTPLMSVPNKTNYLRMHTHVVTSDSNYIYFFKFNDYKLSKDISPLEFVRENIQNIILNKRRKELLAALEKSIYEEAKTENAIKIY